MKKIAFYIDNKNIADVDLRRVEKGNPGIGGTEYLIVLHATLLSKRNNNLNIKLWTTQNQLLPSDIEWITTNNLQSAIHEAESEGFELFILKHDSNNIKKDSLKTNGNMSFCIWCHIFACYWELDYYAKNSSVSNIVYVGKEMYDLYRDHPSFNKATFIFNSVNLTECSTLVNNYPFEKRKNIVTYIGNLVPFKGFHKLAEAWPYIIQQIPDAELYVIGSGALYETSANLGKYGLAEKEYEAYFMKYLSHNDKILPSVHFMGKMGIEKTKIMLQTKVGVPNPTGITETFCLSAVELQAYGAVIATSKAPGYIDTVKNGILCNNVQHLGKAICSMLRMERSNYDDTINQLEKEFSQETIVKQWEIFLTDNKLYKSNRKLENKLYRMKFLKEIIRKISIIIPINHFIPPIERITLFIERKLLKKTTYMDSNIKIQ